MKTVIGNWKMNPMTFADAKSLFDITKKLATKYSNVESIVAPPAIFLRELRKGYRGTRVELCGQHVYSEQEGSYTGEISPAQMKDAGATCVLIGHAERRRMGATNEHVRDTVAATLMAKLSPIVCIGEHVRDEHGEYTREVREQITVALSKVQVSHFKRITIAYEPVWAIGADEAPDANAVHQMVLLVRKALMDSYGEKVMKAVRIVYGGAVNETNARAIFTVPELDGVLVGRASLSAPRLEAIMEAAHTA